IAGIGFSLGTLPIRYLGFPLASKKWSKMHCHQLVEKITSRITSGYAKTLSYAGRLQIINAVLFSIYNFWGAVFILPQSVSKEVDRRCRDYLWGSTDDKRKIALVSWERVCVPKKYGGLNIKSC
ncbi:putative ribonuclease h protein, partial [Nicotiana attenuata]